jgi:uncharacterized protein (TIGR04255 family)
VTKVRQLKNAPIREAIISVSFKNSLAVEDLDRFCNHPEIEKRWPKKNKLFTAQLTIGVDQTQASTTLHQGFMLNGEEGSKTTIGVGIGYLSFHHVRQYVNWDSFFEDFKHVWGIFCDQVSKMDLTNLTVRYLNEIRVSLPLSDGFKEYVTLLPEIPNGISSAVNSFFIQINVPNADNSLNGIVNETFGLQSGGNELTITLDISAVKQGVFVCNSQEMWQTFVDLRNFKNEMFFNCITEKTALMYE